MRRSPALLALLVAVAACDPGFDSVSKVKDFRLLGLRAEPAETVFPREFAPPASPGAAPTPLPVTLSWPVTHPDGVATTVTFLTADPADDSRFQYRIVGCVMDASLECVEGEYFKELAKGDAQLGETAIDVTLPADLVVASMQADPLQGMAGAAVFLTGELVRGETSTRFLRSVIVMPDCGGDRVPNRNPTIPRILSGEKGQEVPLPLDGQGRYHAAAGQTVRLLPDVPAEDRETYEVFVLDEEKAKDSIMCSPDAVPETDEEDMSMAFFATCGDFSVEHKSEKVHEFIEGEEAKAEKDLSAEWSAPGEAQSCMLWFVANDGRGGIGWLSLPVVVE